MQAIICKVDSHITIPKTLPEILLQKIRVHLTYRNPAYDRLRSLGIRNNERKNISFFTEREQQITVPRGTAEFLVRLFFEHQITVKFSSNVEFDKKSLPESQQVFGMLRDYQKECVEKMLACVQGYVVLPCGGGKTFLGAAAALFSGQSTIVLVHTTDLLSQWKDTFRKLGASNIRLIGGGNENNFSPLRKKEVCVATVQTLDRSIEGPALSFLNSAGTIILDEAHHCPAEMFQRVLQASRARYRWGLTATPHRADGFGFLLPMIIGAKLFEMKTKDLVRSNYLMLPKIIPVRVRHNVSFESLRNKKTGKLSMTKIVSELSEDPERDSTIKYLCVQAVKAKRKVLLLVPRVEQAGKLALFLQKRGIRSISVTSKMKKAERDKKLDLFRRGAFDVIVATQLADEGLDLPNLDTLIQTNGGRAEGRAVQRVGRIMRIKEGKKQPIVLDIVDGGPFLSQWESRAMAYISSIGSQPHQIMSPIMASKFL